MKNRDKIVLEVAAELGLTKKQVADVMYSQCLLAKKTIQAKETGKSIYIRQVGTFMSYDTANRLHREKISRTVAAREAKANMQIEENPEDEEDPLYFN